MDRISLKVSCVLSVLDSCTGQPVDNKNLKIKTEESAVAVCKGNGIFVYMGLKEEVTFWIEKDGYYSRQIYCRLQEGKYQYFYAWLIPKWSVSEQAIRIQASFSGNSKVLVFVKRPEEVLWLAKDIGKDSLETELKRTFQGIVEGRYVLLQDFDEEIREVNRLLYIRDRNQGNYALERKTQHGFSNQNSNMIKGYECDVDRTGQLELVLPIKEEYPGAEQCEVLFYDYSGKEIQPETINVVYNGMRRKKNEKYDCPAI